MKKLFKILIVLLFVTNSCFASNKIELNLIEQYLNNIKTLVTNFIQIDQNGQEVTGKFYLMRPGKLRWQYNPPSPILIIINNNLLTHYDYELNQVSHTNASENLGSILARDDIRFNTDIIVKSLEDKLGIISLALVKKDKNDEGEIKLIFNKNPLELKKLEAVDAIGNATIISFEDLVFNQALDKSLFILKNPKHFKNERM